MKQIENISLERMNNGAHYMYLTNVMAHADADEKVKTATTALLATPVSYTHLTLPTKA